MFPKKAWYENGGVYIASFSFDFLLFCSYISFVLFFGVRLIAVVVEFLNDFRFGASIENDLFPNVSFVKTLHFEQPFQVLNNTKMEIFHFLSYEN